MQLQFMQTFSIPDIYDAYVDHVLIDGQPKTHLLVKEAEPNEFKLAIEEENWIDANEMYTEYVNRSTASKQSENRDLESQKQDDI